MSGLEAPFPEDCRRRRRSQGKVTKKRFFFLQRITTSKSVIFSPTPGFLLHSTLAITRPLLLNRLLGNLIKPKRTPLWKRHYNDYQGVPFLPTFYSLGALEDKLVRIKNHSSFIDKLKANFELESVILQAFRPL